MENYNNIGFKPTARIILQLGDQLIRSENIAVLEIIKNSYDACARKVTISMKNLDSPELGSIVIEDDGFGMNYNHFKDIWLVPGTTFKKNQIESEDFISPCKRIPLGEKGIGRFGAHKLGEEIEVVSRKKDEKEAVLKIDWKDFDNDDMLENVPINISERDPEVFKDGNYGTKIVIHKLKNKWTRGAIRSLYTAINSLNSPFESNNSFRVFFKIDKPEWLRGLLSFDEIKDNSLFSAEAELEGNQIVNFKYEFTPWATLKKLKGRIYKPENPVVMRQKEYDEVEKKQVFKDIDLSAYDIGRIKLKMLIFDLDTNLMSLSGIQDKRGFQSYLKDNGGVRVYRDGVRVYDYGEPGNDWLNLDLERVNLPSAKISNNIVIGAIYLDRLASKDLIEKTNREGFIENNAFRVFYSAIRFAINQVVTQRNIDKEKLRSHYGKNLPKEPVVGTLSLLRERISSAQLKDPKLVKDILKMLSEIESDYKTISEIYIRSASAGLGLSIVIHEIEKIISELLKVVDETKSYDRIKLLTKRLGELIQGYSALIKKRYKKTHDLKQVIKDALWNIDFRLRSHNIEMITGFDKVKDFESNVRCSDNLIIGTIINIIDNSIWWLNYGKVQNKKLWVEISDEYPEHITILIADNGPGFTLPPEDVIKPFISSKEGGIGIGLHLASEIMNSHGGNLLFPESDYFSIPEEFKSGAIVGLAFKIKKN
ncbi:ATP-binding protein [Flexistipes sp.]|uniref:ATP-binding protein n=1 Tax=Flexistipes sp. TaxID=3088135 RepID=UPI002E229C25|nr:ATP-binding protein [Flexistipes sp.]